MATINRYVLVDLHDQEGDYEYESFNEAVNDARRLGYAVIEREYEYTDSMLVWTPNGRDMWPPKASTRLK